MSQQWRQGTQLVLPVGVHRWQPPPPWSPEGCLCAPCTVHTNTQDAGFLSSARSLGSDLQLCGSQTWCCQHACISVWQSSSVRPSSTGSSSFAYCQHLSQLPGMHAAPYSWTVAPREPGNAASLPSASAFTTTLWPSKQNSPWAGLWGSAEHPQNPLSLASLLGPLSHELLQLEETAKFKRNQRETVGGLLDPMKEYRSGDSLLVVPAQMSHIKTKLLNQIHSGVLSARTEDLNSHFLNNCQLHKGILLQAGCSWSHLSKNKNQDSVWLEAQEPLQALAHLSVESDGTWLTLCANAFWPRRMPFTARLDLAADVFQGNKFPPARRKREGCC